MPRPLSAVIVDDEAPARRRLAELLERAEGVEVAGQYGSAAEALGAMSKEMPDLLLLDVQMPELDGFELLERIEPKRLPVTIFVTAYDAFALRAFEARALDYLLKPFSDERFEAALARARERIAASERAELGERVLHALRERGTHGPSERIAVRSAGKIVFVDLSTIDWIEAAGVYVTIHAGGREHLARESLAALEERLDPSRFARIHRSAIVAVDRVAELRFDGNGSYRVVLRNGAELKLSRRHRDALEARLSLGQETD